MKTADHAYQTLGHSIEKLKGGERLHMQHHLLMARFNTSLYDSADDFNHAYRTEQDRCAFCLSHPRV